MDKAGPKESRKRIHNRPCAICGKWFIQNPRVGKRQKTCASKECKHAQRLKIQAKWRAANPTYWSEKRLQEKIHKKLEPLPDKEAKRGRPPEQFQVEGAQVEIRKQLLIIMILLAEHLKGRPQSSILIYLNEIMNECDRILPSYPQVQKAFASGFP